MAQFNFGHITEIAVCIFFSEIFKHIDFQTKKIDASKLSKEKLIANILQNQYSFGKKTIIRKEKNSSGDDVTVSLLLKTTKDTLDFFKEFSTHKEHHEKLFEIIDSLNTATFVRNIYVSKSAPYKDIQYILDGVRELVMNGTLDTIEVSLACSGMDSGKKTPPTKITSTFEFVPKADIVIELDAYETLTKKKYPQKISKFSIKGNSTTIESTGISSAISLLYKIVDADRDIFVEHFQPSLALSGQRKKEFIDEFLATLRRRGKIKCNTTAVIDNFRGLIGGSDRSTYFKVLDKVRTIDMNHAIGRIKNSKMTFIYQEGSVIYVRMNEHGKDITIFKITFTLSKKYVGAEISITTEFMS